ncbi:MAG: hypothetical protein FJ271_33155 [Planctomycetes bacterium]|nr:hypothetical protein [Planctomycetota bacterium]
MQKLSATVVTASLLISAMSNTAVAQDKADRDADTLLFYLSKSEAVVVGKVTDGLQRIGVDFNTIPVNVIGFQVKVTDSIKGNVAAKQTIMVTVTRAYSIGQSLPPEQGKKVVLFLKSSGASWVSADKWFGMQPYSRTFVEHLKRVKSQAKAPPKAR